MKKIDIKIEIGENLYKLLNSFSTTEQMICALKDLWELIKKLQEIDQKQSKK